MLKKVYVRIKAKDYCEKDPDVIKALKAGLYIAVRAMQPDPPSGQCREEILKGMEEWDCSIKAFAKKEMQVDEVKKIRWTRWAKGSAPSKMRLTVFVKYPKKPSRAHEEALERIHEELNETDPRFNPKQYWALMDALVETVASND